jgi:hypothetical protein
MKRTSRTLPPTARVWPLVWLLSSAACVAQVTIGEGVAADGGGASGAGGSPSPPAGDARGDRGPRNCGGEAAQGGNYKGNGPWNGSAGNPYGYPADSVPADDCSGFLFHDTCTFWELCEIQCTRDGDCPAVAGGPAPACRPQGFVPLPDTPPKCVLPCADGAACPDGMECVYHPYGFGDICMWEGNGPD